MSRNRTRSVSTCCTRPCAATPGTDLKRTPKFTLKADGAAASVPEGTTFALGANAPAGASVDMANGTVTLNSRVGGTVTVPSR